MSKAIHRAMELHQQGKLDQAETAYAAILAAKPRHFDALHQLGILRFQQGRLADALACMTAALNLDPKAVAVLSNIGFVHANLNAPEQALASYDRALALEPRHPEALNNRGLALMALRRPDEALASFDRAIAARPNYREAHFNRGNALMALNRLEPALASFDRAIALKPDDVDALCNRGVVFTTLKRFAEAVASYDRALAHRPTAELLTNRGHALIELGRADEALASYDRALALKPDHAAALAGRGLALLAIDRHAEALAAIDRALSLKPDDAEGHYNRGNALMALERPLEALASYDRALALAPDHALAFSNRAAALHAMERLDEAVASYGRAVALSPDNPRAWHNLGATLADQGRHRDASAAHRRAIALDPDNSAYGSSLLATLNYDDGVAPAELFAAHRDWARRHAPALPQPLVHANDRDPARRLKVGYLSTDFRQHAVAKFLEPVLNAHDRTAVEVFCYAEVIKPDAVTERFRRRADGFVTTVGMSDDILVERIRRDGIDILVDLAGHMAGNRLMAAARRPAPVQVTWLGYPNTTGLDAIDYRLVDAVTDPEPEADALASENLIRLADGFLCYGGAADAPEPSAAPCLLTGAVTFGSFNNPAKLSEATLDAWATLLGRVPRSRLLAKGKSFIGEAARTAFLAAMERRGVAADRIELTAFDPNWQAHMALYRRIDIAVDSFPYNGTTTTCDALWMGVPVVALMGDRHAGRVSASVLTTLGLADLVGGSVEHYVEIAAALARDTTRLTDLRRSLRPRMASSPLCDAPAFARKIEAAYRAMWRQWCATPAPGGVASGVTAPSPGSPPPGPAPAATAS